MALLLNLFRNIRRSVFFSFIRANRNIHYSLLEKIRESIYLKEALENYKTTVVIDVGANEGQFGSDLRDIGFKGKIISFEPASQPYSKLAEKCSRDKLWECYKLGLGKENDVLKLNIPEDTKLSSFLASDIIDADKFETVEIKRLDSIIFDMIPTLKNESIFLKIDTQGFDINVLEGSVNLIPFVNLLMSEISVKPLYNGSIDYKEALTYYESHGFRLYNLSTVARSHSNDVLELNCIMVK